MYDYSSPSPLTLTVRQRRAFLVGFACGLILLSSIIIGVCLFA